jgi:hypothetical protein
MPMSTHGGSRSVQVLQVRWMQAVCNQQQRTDVLSVIVKTNCTSAPQKSHLGIHIPPSQRTDANIQENIPQSLKLFISAHNSCVMHSHVWCSTKG